MREVGRLLFQSQAWSQVRGVAVAFHLLAVLLMSVPAPRGISRAAVDDPEIAGTFEDWATALRTLGLPVTTPALKDFAFVWGTRLDDGRSGVTNALQPYVDLCGVRQGWSMFGTVSREPGRLRVEIHEDGAWRPIYVARSDRYVWNRTALEQERFRTVINGYGHLGGKKSYEAFVGWLSEQAAGDFPAADLLAAEIEVVRLVPPEELLRLGALPVVETTWRTERELSR